MYELAAEVIRVLNGKTLATAESCTGGGIGASLTEVPGSSAVYKGGVITYTNEIKENLLNVPSELLCTCGAVSGPVAEAMALGSRNVLSADIAVSVTGLAGPSGDGSDYPVGTVFVGYADSRCCISKKFFFCGDREMIRRLATEAALGFILEHNR